MDLFEKITKSIDDNISEEISSYAYKLCDHVGNALQVYQECDISDSIKRDILIGILIYGIDDDKYHDNLEKIIKVMPDVDKDLIISMIAYHRYPHLSQESDHSYKKYKYILRDCLILAAVLDQFPPKYRTQCEHKYLDKTVRVYTQDELDNYIRCYNNVNDDISFIDDCYVRLYHCYRTKNILSQNKYILNALAENYKKLSIVVLNFWNGKKYSIARQIDLNDDHMLYHSNKNAMKNLHLEHFYNYFLDLKNFDKVEFRIKELDVENGIIFYMNYNLKMLYLSSNDMRWCVRADELYRIVSSSEVDGMTLDYFWCLRREPLLDQKFIEYVLKGSILQGRHSMEC